MPKFGLPTFPIADGMAVNKRRQEEYEWLLEHGWLQYHWAGKTYRHHKDGNIVRENVISYQDRFSKTVEEKPFEVHLLTTFLQKLQNDAQFMHHWEWYSYEEGERHENDTVQP